MFSNHKICIQHTRSFSTEKLWGCSKSYDSYFVILALQCCEDDMKAESIFPDELQSHTHERRPVREQICLSAKPVSYLYELRVNRNSITEKNNFTGNQGSVAFYPNVLIFFFFHLPLCLYSKKGDNRIVLQWPMGSKDWTSVTMASSRFLVLSTIGLPH